MGNPSQAVTIRFARRSDALCMAEMARDLVEHGLGWSWTRDRILRTVRHPETNAIIASRDGERSGFAIMKYGEDDAHLLLLAVQPTCQRAGIGATMLDWLERSARAAGIARVTLEARASNADARAFYARLGYAEAQVLPGYYGGRETSVRMVKALHVQLSGAS